MGWTWPVALWTIGGVLAAFFAALHIGQVVRALRASRPQTLSRAYARGRLLAASALGLIGVFIAWVGIDIAAFKPSSFRIAFHQDLIVSVAGIAAVVTATLYFNWRRVERSNGGST